METKSGSKSPSEFKGLSGIEYFDFEEDFIEKNIRCIPMIVRFKMDKAGIKLKLDQWSRFIIGERIDLAKMPCNTKDEVLEYRHYLSGLVKKRSHKDVTDLAIDNNPAWANISVIPELLLDRTRDEGLGISLRQWRGLTELQRFALLKLSRPGHESKNFTKAIIEFGLTSYILPDEENQKHEIISYYKD